MGKTVDFFYGIGSRYSYLAATQMERLEQDSGASVR
jgi:2-hydroxychromene-2-carboxylate isomerase